MTKINICSNVIACNWTDLLADWNILDKKTIKEMCNPECIRLDTCVAILELLNKGKNWEAFTLIKLSNEDMLLQQESETKNNGKTWYNKTR